MEQLESTQGRTPWVVGAFGQCRHPGNRERGIGDTFKTVQFLFLSVDLISPPYSSTRPPPSRTPPPPSESDLFFFLNIFSDRKQKKSILRILRGRKTQNQI